MGRKGTKRPKRSKAAKTLVEALERRTCTTMVVLSDGETWTSLEDCEFVVLESEPALDLKPAEIIRCARGSGLPPYGVYDLQRMIMELPLAHLERYRLAPRMHFGIGERSDHTLEDIGQDLEVTRERVRQIEAKALHKLRHPSRNRHLKAFTEETK